MNIVRIDRLIDKSFSACDCDSHARDAARLSWPTDVPRLRAGRVHEAVEAVNGGGEGGSFAAARAFTAMVAATHASSGAVLWIRRGRVGQTAHEALDPYGLAVFFDPARLLEVVAPTPKDVLWAMEEALRSGAAPIVVAEPGRCLDLTASRRLQLAAEAGGGVGLSLTSETERPRSSAVETRWRVSPLPIPSPIPSRDPSGRPEDAPSASGGEAAAWRWELQKNKRGVVGAWFVRLRTAGVETAAAQAA